MLPFIKIYLSNYQQGMTSFTEFSYVSFNNLNQEIIPYFDIYTTYVFIKGGLITTKQPTGRERIINPTLLIGLVLTWSRTQGCLRNLGMLFGFNKSTVSVWLRFGFRLIIKALHSHPLAKLGIPTHEEIA